MPEFFVGRQPIFDASLKVIGYELLYRAQDTSDSGAIDGDQATSQVIVNGVAELGLERLVGNRRAFINLTRSFILNADLLPAPRDGQIVLEVLEDEEVDAELIAGVRRLADKGYRIALDDFVFRESMRPLVDLAHIVKVDLRAVAPDDLAMQVKLLRQFPVKLIAEKVETPEELDYCKSLGFDYFQGYFLCRPRNLKGKRLPTNRLNTLKLLAKLQHPGTSVDELEQIISHDVTLSYKLLRYINSSAFIGRKEIRSIRHAIVYLGQAAIRNWATLIALTGVDDKPNELMVTALARGKMCELLAAGVDPDNAQSAFTVGLFSVLDAMLDAPLQELMAELPFAADIRTAILAHDGPYGQLLKSAVAYDRGDWEQIPPGEALSAAQLAELYLSAIEWAETTAGGLRA